MGRYRRFGNNQPEKLSRKEVDGVAKFFRGRASICQDFAEGLEDGVYPSDLKSVIAVFQQQADMYLEWIEALKS